MSVQSLQMILYTVSLHIEDDHADDFRYVVLFVASKLEANLADWVDIILGGCRCRFGQDEGGLSEFLLHCRKTISKGNAEFRSQKRWIENSNRFDNAMTNK